ncbi:calcium-binding protein, partial [Paracoccus sanguinis]|uniref:calcium-binding protein n=1 Tax=Paracoccus sanguinis TaxID=1545044 RepID=UPI0039E1260B
MATLQLDLAGDFSVGHLDQLLATTLTAPSETEMIHQDGGATTIFSGSFNDEGHYPDWTGTVSAVLHARDGVRALWMQGLNVAYPSVLTGFDYARFFIDALEYQDTIHGSAGADWLNGFADNDRIWGGAGDDTLEGGAGNDTIDGESGNDLFLADAAVSGDWIEGDDGIDTLSYAGITGAVTLNLGLTGAQNVEGGRVSGVENLIGGTAGDRLSGCAVANRIEGGAGADTLWGAAGADTLIGGTGDDLLVGGAGADRLDGG